MRPIATVTIVLIAASYAIAQMPVKAPMKPKSKAEATAVNALITAADPDSRIKAADELITKFADTPFKSFALYVEAEAWSQKGDTDKTIVYAEQAVDADATNYQAYVLLTKTYSATTHVNDLDKAEKLSKIDKYSKLALSNLENAPKPNDKVSDAEWTSAKNDYAGQVYLGMGIAAVFTNKLDDAKADFEKVATMDTDATDLIRAGRALMDVKKWADAIVWLDKAATFPGAPDQIKKIAESDKARAQAMLPKK